MSVSVGSFAKSTNTSVPVTQDVAHGLGETPKALIMWVAKVEPLTGFNTWTYPSLGFTDQDRNSICIGTGSQGDNAATSATGRGIGAYAFASSNQDGTSASFIAGTISAWDSTNFTVNWTANTNKAVIVGFLAVGGGGVQSKVVTHALDGDTGSDPITGAGFKPDLALMLNIGSVTAALPAVAKNAVFGFGAANKDGQQWGVAYESTDNLATTDTKRAQRTDNCLVSLSTTDGSLTYSWLGAYSSMDNDGMTLDVGTAGTAASHLGVLFLKGVRSHVTSFTKEDSDVNDTVQTVNLNLTPQGVMLASFQATATTSVVAEGYFGLGASDGSDEYSAATTDGNDLTDTDANGGHSNTKAFMKVNNNTETTSAECDVAIGANKLDLTWTASDADQTQILVLALTTTVGGGGGGGGGSGGQGGGNGNGGGGPPGGGGGGGPPGQTRRTIIGQRRRQRRGLVGGLF